MKAVILAGGFGTRLAEHTDIKPKPLVEIGDMPIIWHIMKIYSAAGINDFILCLGYKGYLIKEFFCNYHLHTSDVTVSLETGTIDIVNTRAEKWSITMVDTGLNTMTGGRIKRIQKYLGNDDFCVTYGDGLAKIDIQETVQFHKEHGKLATITAVAPPGRFGALNMSGNEVVSFQEKPAGDGGFINGGFFVFNTKIIDYIKDDTTVLEQEPLAGLARDNQLQAFVHNDFWQPMDTLRDKKVLDDLWANNKAPWKIWS